QTGDGRAADGNRVEAAREAIETRNLAEPVPGRFLLDDKFASILERARGSQKALQQRIGAVGRIAGGEYIFAAGKAAQAAGGGDRPASLAGQGGESGIAAQGLLDLSGFHAASGF